MNVRAWCVVPRVFLVGAVMKLKLLLAAASVALIGAATTSSAATVVFDSFVKISDDSVFPSDLAVSVTDIVGGVVLQSSGTGNGNISAFYIELTDANVSMSLANISLDPSGAPPLSAPPYSFALNTSGIQGALDLNPNTFVFDFGFGDQNAFPIGTPVYLFNTSLNATDFSVMGLRLQSTGPNLGGSAKVIDNTPEVIPLPAAGWLLLAGVGGLAAMRRRKTAA